MFQLIFVKKIKHVFQIKHVVKPIKLSRLKKFVGPVMVHGPQLERHWCTVCRCH